ncbi:MAG TPA: GxxExxY protein [Candidatus Eisenbacteria bacterium]|nr:GxxExxY protein [Candidatus Eisenbacteria bacterium]
MNTDQQPASRSILIEWELTEKVLGAAFKVLNTLGTGFLEKVYENALSFQLQRIGLSVESQKVFHVKYEGAIVGEYQADLVVAGKVIAECKAISNMDSVHEAQLINYLKASGVHVGLLINFGRPTLQYRRLVF